MPSDTLYGNQYKYILVRIDAASRYKVERPLRTKQALHIAEMIADIYKVVPIKEPKIFQCDNGSKFKTEVTKMLEKHGVNPIPHGGGGGEQILPSFRLSSL